MVKIRLSAVRFCFDVALLAFVATLCIGPVVLLRHAGQVRERFGRQIYTAEIIGRALVTYEKEHNGLVPTAMSSLNVNKEVPSDGTLVTEKDLSHFRLLPLRTRSGKRPVDVVFEGVDEGTLPKWARILDPDTTLRIYRDGKALLEDTKIPKKE